MRHLDVTGDVAASAVTVEFNGTKTVSDLKHK